VNASAAGPRDGVVARSFALLGCFGDRHRFLTLAQLARSSGLPVNTTLRLARNLVSVGALDRDDEGRFSVGLRLFEIAALAPRGRGWGLRSAAMPFMTDLRDITGEHVLLSVREGDEAVLVERLSARGASYAEYRIGGRTPLPVTGAGLVLLAFSAADVQDRALAAFVPPGAIDGVQTANELRLRLADIRRLGSLTASRSLPFPRETVAVPVTGPRGDVVAALSVVTRPGGLGSRSLVPWLTASARAITRDAY
jgi:DNA-binding IclR family transcriptional regulator